MAQGLSGSSDEIQNHIALATTRPILEELVWRLQLRNESGDLLNPEKLLIPGMTAALDAAPFVEIMQHQGSDIILVTAIGRFPFCTQRSDNREWDALDAQHLSNGIFIWK